MRKCLVLLVVVSLVSVTTAVPVGAQTGAPVLDVDQAPEPIEDPWEGLEIDGSQEDAWDSLEDPPKTQRHPTLICGTHAYFTGPFIVSGNCLSPFDLPPVNPTYGGLVAAVCRAVDSVLDAGEDLLDQYLESESERYRVYRKAVQRTWKVYKKLPKKYRRIVRRGVSYASVACFIATP